MASDQNRITQAQLAERLGVSQVTVHKALTGHPEVSEERREQIRALAMEEGYRLNAAASTMRSGRHHCIALLHSTDVRRSPIPSGMLAGMYDSLRLRDFQMMFAELPDEELVQDGSLPRCLREWRSDGMLINYHKNPPTGLTEMIERYRLPSVWINYDVEQDCVRPDDFRAGYDATRRLIEAGRKRIFYVCYCYRRNNWHYSELERRDGYTQAMMEAGLEPLAVDRYHPEFGGENDLETWRRALSRTDRPDAVLGYSARDLNAVLHAVSWLHLDVPADIELATFAEGDVPVRGYHATVWGLPDYEVGRLAVDMLFRRIEHPGQAEGTVRVPFRPPEEMVPH